MFTPVTNELLFTFAVVGFPFSVAEFFSANVLIMFHILGLAITTISGFNQSVETNFGRNMSQIDFTL